MKLFFTPKKIKKEKEKGIKSSSENKAPKIGKSSLAF